ncbi:hypothetical protein [Microcoleus anatoxicus]|uniref:hypothetical protein n=1 Tax=Microcoleus anatoxicus TaxID=2705319 RepID=UPI0030C9D9F9
MQGFGMGKAIALSDNKSDRTLGFGMGKAIAPFGYLGKKGDRSGKNKKLLHLSNLSHQLIQLPINSI